MQNTILNFDWENTASLLVDEINRKARILGANYKDISDVLNVDSAYIHKVLNKKKDLSLKTFIRICLALVEINKSRNEPIPSEELLPSSILKEVGL